MYKELQFLFSAHCLMMLYICTKFVENILHGFSLVADRTCDGQTDGQTDNYRKKQDVSPGGGGRPGGDKIKFEYNLS